MKSGSYADSTICGMDGGLRYHSCIERGQYTLLAHGSKQCAYRTRAIQILQYFVKLMILFLIKSFCLPRSSLCCCLIMTMMYQAGYGCTSPPSTTNRIIEQGVLGGSSPSVVGIPFWTSGIVCSTVSGSVAVRVGRNLLKDSHRECVV